MSEDRPSNPRQDGPPPGSPEPRAKGLPIDPRELLGGYATGTLTPEELEYLMAAALEDQDLFDELEHEVALREMLEQPGAKDRLLAALADDALPAIVAPALERDTPEPEPPQASWFGTPQATWFGWLRWEWAAGLAAAAALVAVVLTVMPGGEQTQLALKEAPVTVESVPLNAPAPVAEPEATLSDRLSEAETAQSADLGASATGEAAPVAIVDETRARAAEPRAAVPENQPQNQPLNQPATELSEPPVAALSAGALSRDAEAAKTAAPSAEIAEAQRADRAQVAVIAPAPAPVKPPAAAAPKPAPAKQPVVNAPRPVPPPPPPAAPKAVAPPAPAAVTVTEQAGQQGTQGADAVARRAEAVAPQAAGNAAAIQEPAATTPNGAFGGFAAFTANNAWFAFRRTEGTLTVTPTEAGYLTVTVQGQAGAPLFPEQAVPARIGAVIALPDNAGPVVVSFARTQGAAAVAARTSPAVEGSISVPPAGTTRVTVIVPAAQ